MRCLEADASCELKGWPEKRIDGDGRRATGPSACVRRGLSRGQGVPTYARREEAHRKYEKAQVAEKERRNMLEERDRLGK